MFIAQVTDTIVTGYQDTNIDSGLFNAKGKIIDLNNDGQSEVVLVGLTSTNPTSGKPSFTFTNMMIIISLQKSI